MENWPIWLDIAGNFIGIGTFLISILIWWRLRLQSRKIRDLAVKASRMENYQELKNYHKSVQTEKPKAFCLSLVPNQVSIKDSVQRFLKGQKLRMPIVELNADGLTGDGIQKFVEDIRLLRRTELSDATELHIFLQGPVQAGVLIGAALDNWIPVKLYQYVRELGTYEYWGPLVK